jgi:hypothetical protein
MDDDSLLRTQLHQFIQNASPAQLEKMCSFTRPKKRKRELVLSLTAVTEQVSDIIS